MTTIPRRTLLAGLASAVPVVAIGQMTATAAVNRPTGSDYVRYEQLYRSGDTVSDALGRLTEPKIVTFPEGKFECSDFNSGYQAGITIPSICRGILGSGKGQTGGASGTVFTIRPMSSRKGNGRRDAQGQLYVPVQDDKTPCQLTVLKQLNQRSPSVFGHFQVAGTEQGHLFNAFQVYGTAGSNKFSDVLVTGWDGDAGAPPGETYGLAVNGPGQHALLRVEADGRRTKEGEVFGAMGITMQNTVGAVLTDCKAHHTRAAGFVAFQSFDGTLKRFACDARIDEDRRVGNGSYNFERTGGWILKDCTFTGRPRKVHVTHSNDSWTLTRGGRTYSTSDGKLTIVNPTYNDLWGNNHLMIQSWTPYWNGDTIRTAPLVVKSDGKTLVRYSWVHGTSKIIG